MRILFVCSELRPFSGASPIAEANADLAQALRRAGHRVSVVTPLYPEIDADRFGLARRLRTLHLQLGERTQELGILEGKFPGNDAQLTFVDAAPLFDAGPVCSAVGDEYRACHLLATAAIAIATDFDWQPDLVHAHGWQTGLLPLLVRQTRPAALADSTLVFSVHDPSQLGLFGPEILDELDLGREAFHPDGVEFHGQVSLLKAGLVHADKVVIAAPAVAEEIRSPEHGFGLDGLYRSLGERMSGIVGGIDDRSYDPQTDHRLIARYDATNLAGKRACKRALQLELGLNPNPQRLLVLVPGPISTSAGTDLLVQTAEQWSPLKLQLAFIGETEEGMHEGIADLVARFPDRVVHRQPTEDLAVGAHDLPRSYLAGADALLFTGAPQGLLHGKAMRYGAAVLGPAAGLLRDTVVDFDEISRTGTGVCFAPGDPASLLGALHRVLSAYDYPARWNALVANTMKQAYSWQLAARRFEDAYGLRR